MLLFMIIVKQQASNVIIRQQIFLVDFQTALNDYVTRGATSCKILCLFYTFSKFVFCLFVLIFLVLQFFFICKAYYLRASEW